MASSACESVKKVCTDEERAELVKKLDEDLDEFIEGLAKKSAKEQPHTFDFDEWCRQLDEHPCFMNELKPGADGEYSEAIQALQALKYEGCQTSEDRIEGAREHKKEGNKHFKYGKYRWARDAYTNGIKLMCKDRRLNSELFANRAAAQKHLSNLRSAIRDCVFARKFDPSNQKVLLFRLFSFVSSFISFSPLILVCFLRDFPYFPLFARSYCATPKGSLFNIYLSFNFHAIIRCAECLLELGYGRQCLEWIDSSEAGLNISHNSGSEQKPVWHDCMKKLRQNAEKCAIREERDQRKAARELEMDLAAKSRLLSSLESRHLHFRPRFSFRNPSMFEWSFLEVRLPQIHEHQSVYIDEDGNLRWPLLIQYPQAGQTDFITDCSENNTLDELLEEVLKQPAGWDMELKFRRDNIRLFVSLDTDEECVEEVDFADTLREILSTKDFVIIQGLPVIQIYSKDYMKTRFSLMAGKKYKPK
ncbi:hypothetical protein AB6A40_001278 [Gnathostoma spinigerum]|uniref:Cns1/TTC4 wheel domain-containing protein n=1 Tax=Gnathostoma spinigerum TaxID=75299 RepID=A0ABD6EB52_9BILA